MQVKEVLSRLKSMADPKAVEGMARYGINPESTLGVSIPKLRSVAKEAGKDRELAEALWASGIHEARILATMVDDFKLVNESQMERWVGDFNSWDVCDQCCNNLFRKTDLAHAKAVQWSARPEEFVKRAGFTLMACLAVHDKNAGDDVFEGYLPIIHREAGDGRNFVKKAVNWALRQIGKRNLALNVEAVEAARQIRELDSKAAKWVATDAIKELTSDAVQKRLGRKE